MRLVKLFFRRKLTILGRGGSLFELSFEGYVYPRISESATLLSVNFSNISSIEMQSYTSILSFRLVFSPRVSFPLYKKLWYKAWRL